MIKEAVDDTLRDGLFELKVKGLCALKHPVEAFRCALLRDMNSLVKLREAYEREIVSAFLNSYSKRLDPYYYSTHDNRTLANAICKFVTTVYPSMKHEIEREMHQMSLLLPFTEPYYVLLYQAVRLLRPKLILETGVCRGYSTCVLLKALSTLRSGHLYSIDLPSREYIRDDGTTHKDECDGYLVPDNLKVRWSLIFGDSTHEMPKILHSIEKLDFFIHDSEHTYKVMMFEFAMAWEKLAEGGILVSDDIDLSRAFYDFARSVRKKPLILDRTNDRPRSIGIIVK